MIRTTLCGLLSGATLLVGLATAIVQSSNHERGQALNALKDECSMLEAVNGERSERILALDWGPAPAIETGRPASPARDADGARAIERASGGAP